MPKEITLTVPDGSRDKYIIIHRLASPSPGTFVYPLVGHCLAPVCSRLARAPCMEEGGATPAMAQCIWGESGEACHCSTTFDPRFNVS